MQADRQASHQQSWQASKLLGCRRFAGGGLSEVTRFSALMLTCWLGRAYGYAGADDNGAEKNGEQSRWKRLRLIMHVGSLNASPGPTRICSWGEYCLGCENLRRLSSLRPSFCGSSLGSLEIV